ncbi:DNA gyrase inhibitor YacG [Pseudoalteromonas sp.]|uniref:DNA gyrase inhibitor YacG n=1 Tax=Pseudoalteromonas sp. TaxID=53249 RepID=UPI0035624107
MPTSVNCPTCKKKVLWQASSEFRPFCSKRCQLIDLGEWSEENHTISTPLTPEQAFTPDTIEDIEAMLAANPEVFFKE